VTEYSCLQATTNENASASLTCEAVHTTTSESISTRRYCRQAFSHEDSGVLADGYEETVHTDSGTNSETESSDNSDSEESHDSLCMNAGASTSFHCNVTGLLIYLFLFKHICRLSQVAFSHLFNFVTIFLSKLDKNFQDCPSTPYRAQKALGLESNILLNVICPKCHTRHSLTKVKAATSEVVCAQKTMHIHCSEPLNEKLETSKDRLLWKVQ
jgi:hypothetical protein